MALRLLILVLVSSSAWGQLLVPLKPAEAPNQTDRPAPWMEELKFTPDMSPKPVMQIAPANFPSRKTPRRAKQALEKKIPVKKDDSIFSNIPIIQRIPLLLDGTQAEVASRLTGLANNVDSFFGETLNEVRKLPVFAQTCPREKNRRIGNVHAGVGTKYPRILFELLPSRFCLGAFLIFLIFRT
jgi:hypothetical protein